MEERELISWEMMPSTGPSHTTFCTENKYNNLRVCGCNQYPEGIHPLSLFLWVLMFDTCATVDWSKKSMKNESKINNLTDKNVLDTYTYMIVISSNYYCKSDSVCTYMCHTWFRFNFSPCVLSTAVTWLPALLTECVAACGVTCSLAE